MKSHREAILGLRPLLLVKLMGVAILLTGAILLVDVSTMNMMEFHFHVTAAPLWHSQALVAERRAMLRDAACLTLIKDSGRCVLTLQ